MSTIQIPELPARCGSWVVKRRDSGEVIGEFFERANLLRVNAETCVVVTTLEHLRSLNKATDAAPRVIPMTPGPLPAWNLVPVQGAQS